MNTRKYIAMGLGLATLGFTMPSCVKDLDVEPINPQKTMELDNDALFNKIYASFSLTGQTGPDGNKDLTSIEDEGTTDYFRMKWYMNEFTADEASWVWVTDPGVPDLLHTTYSAANTFSEGFYYRAYFTITLCNFFLSETSPNTPEMARRHAEVRMIRAINYHDLLDLYGNVPMALEVSDKLPEQIQRADLFNFVEGEYKDALEALADAGTNTYGRLDKVAAQMMLARLYLNAEVYTGTPMFDKAKDMAEAVLNNGHYELLTEGSTNAATGEVFTAYQKLFLADNDCNGAQKEIIFPALLEFGKTMNHGGMNFLVLSTYSVEMSADIPSGTDNSWGKCTRVRKELVQKFWGDRTAPLENNVEAMTHGTEGAGDDRALFYGKGYTMSIDDESDAKQGFSCVKFRNVTTTTEPLANSKVDCDLPLLRIAEAYLTYAEASIRLSGPNNDASQKINALRDRAHNVNGPKDGGVDYTLDDVCDEWAREFWFEGRRRMDLVRFNRFAGQSSYKWQWMGGSVTGASIPAFRNVFALPESDLNANRNLKQNAGY